MKIKRNIPKKSMEKKRIYQNRKNQGRKKVQKNNKTVKEDLKIKKETKKSPENPKRKKSEGGFLGKVFALFIFASISASFAFIIHRYSQISTKNYESIDIAREIDEMDNEIKVLKLKLEELNSSKVMEEKARQLGFKDRSKEQIVYILVD